MDSITVNLPKVLPTISYPSTIYPFRYTEKVGKTFSVF